MKTTLSTIKKQLESWRKQKNIFPVQLILMLFLILYTPLAYGSIKTEAILIIDISVLFIALVYITDKFINNPFTVRHYPALWLTIPLLLFFTLHSILSIYPYQTNLALQRLEINLLVFFLVINIFTTKRRLLLLVWIILSYGSFYALAALFFREGSFLGFDIFHEPNHINFTYLNRNHFAGYLEMIVWLVVGMGILKKGTLRIILFTLAFFISVAIFMSLSRGGVISLVSSAIFFTLLYSLKTKEKKGIVIALLFATIFLLFIFSMGIDPLLSRFEKIETNLDEEVGRMEYWKSTYALFLDKPWFGTGFGTFSTAIPRFQTLNTSKIIFLHTDNEYLELLSEIGIIGFLIVMSIFVSFYLYLIKRVFQLKSKIYSIIGISALTSIFSILIHSLFDYNLHIPANSLLFAILFGTAYLSTHGQVKKQLLNIHLSKNKKIAFILLFFSLFLTSIYLLSRSFITKQYIEDATLYEKDKDYNKAILFGKKAIQQEKKNASLYIKVAGFFQKKSKLEVDSITKKVLNDSALAYYSMGIQKNPNNGYYYYKKAHLLKSVGQVDSARIAFEQAAYYSPVSAFANFGLAIFYFEHNEIDLGITASKKALSSDERFIQSIISLFIKNGLSYDTINNLLPNTILATEEYIKYLNQNNLDSLVLIQLNRLFDLEPSQHNAEKHIRYYYNTKNKKEAITLCKNYLSLFPKSLMLQDYLARLYLDHNNIEEARKIYTKLLHDHPNNASIYYQITLLYRKEKNTERILKSLKKASILAPKNFQYKFALAQEYKRQGLFQLAYIEYKGCLELNPEHIPSQKAIKYIQLLGEK